MEKIRKFIYDYVDDKNDYPQKYYFIGTQEEFNQMRKDEQEMWGSCHYNIEESDPTEEEIKNYEWEKEDYATGW